MLGIIGSVAGAIEGVSDFASKIADWLRQKEHNAMVRQAENADDMEKVIKRHEEARRARALSNANSDSMQSDPANRDGE